MHSELEPLKQKTYFRNCKKFASVQGSLEVFSQAAAIDFFQSLDSCRRNPFVNTQGEDWFFGHCMTMIGIGAVKDYSLMDDSYCTGNLPDAQCKSGMPAFHPFKTSEAYLKCL